MCSESFKYADFKNNFLKIKKYYFNTKNILKNNYNHTPKQNLNLIRKLNILLKLTYRCRKGSLTLTYNLNENGCSLPLSLRGECMLSSTLRKCLGTRFNPCSQKILIFFLLLKFNIVYTFWIVLMC